MCKDSLAQSTSNIITETMIETATEVADYCPVNAITIEY